MSCFQLERCPHFNIDKPCQTVDGDLCYRQKEILEVADKIRTAQSLGAPAKQQTTAPCCSVEDSHIPETGTSA
jgi:hypothetical protein